jgi:PncC family amidohydrolase
MAIGVKKRIGTECAISTTGIAGPEGGTKTKPVGLVFIGIAIADFTNTLRFEFKGSRDEIRKQTVCKSLDCLHETLSHIN